MSNGDNSAQNDARDEILKIVRSMKSYIYEDLEKGRNTHFYMKRETKKAASTAAREIKNIEMPLPRATGKKETLDDIRKDLGDCKRCPLHCGRKSIVFGEGNPSAELMFIGEGPGRDEDIQGRPFVGRAGQLLNKIIAAMGLKREEVYIANVVKCRPPENREPKPDEVEACTPFLARQIETIQPKVLCALGMSAARHILQKDVPLSVLRGRFQEYRGMQVMVTYHPAYLLRNPSSKKQVWEDMQKIMAVLKKGEP
jgi:uracil-DNA glycosylase family 4